MSKDIKPGCPLPLTLHITDEICRHILTTCYEGGSAYWLQCQEVERDAEHNVVKIIGCEDVTGEMPDDKKTWGDATIFTIQTGIQRLLQGTVAVSQEIRQQVFALATDEDDSSWDAWTADAILQAGLLNDITFG